uniref:Uncharacterized protein n=1 Tax=Panagrolaimus sp. PS1159 TaxID=55785 RepID=A0AC35EYS1_9BILA
MSFVPTFVFYFFGVINTWSRLPIFGLNELERSMISSSALSSTALINITVERPLRSPNFDEFINSPESFHQQSYLSILSVCTDINQLLSIYGSIDLEYQWNFSAEKNSYQISNIKSKNCSILWQAPFAGNFKIFVEAKHMGSSNILFRGSTKTKIHDYWIVAIGDSFASGEGNPDKSLLESDSVKWISG